MCTQELRTGELPQEIEAVLKAYIEKKKRMPTVAVTFRVPLLEYILYRNELDPLQREYVREEVKRFFAEVVRRVREGQPHRPPAVDRGA